MEKLEQITGLTYESNFQLLMHFSSIPFAIFVNQWKTSETSYFGKDVVCGLFGVSILVASLKWTFFHPFSQWALGYLVLRRAPRDYLGILTLAAALGYVFCINIYKYFHAQEKYILDYSGPIMIGAIKLSSLAYAVQDGEKPDNELSKLQREHVIREHVSLRKHFNYYFSFIGVFFGPAIFYRQHRRFMYGEVKPRANTLLAISTLLYGLLGIAIYSAGSKIYPVSRNYDQDVREGGFLYQNYMLAVSTFVQETKYYFAWLSAEAICLFAGLHKDENGKSIVAIVNPVKIQLATSLREYIQNWNIYTATWLRFVIYERVPRYKILCTFFMSGIWHGFYPGYLLMFVPLGFYTMLNTKLYKSVAPHLAEPLPLRILYTLVCWWGATITIAFNGLPFFVLHLDKTLQIQRDLYFYPHIIVAVLLILLPSTSSKSTSSSGEHEPPPTASLTEVSGPSQAN